MRTCKGLNPLPCGKTLSVLVLLSCLTTVDAAPFTHEIDAFEDAFVRASFPTLNYGAAGALSVAGPSATNNAGVPQGAYDTLIKFDVGDAIDSFDTVFGDGNWTVHSVTLELRENPAPRSDRFNLGAGTLAIEWLSDDGWSEGPGRPNNDHVGVGDEITWNLLESMLSSAETAALGVFPTELLSVRYAFDLAVDPLLDDDIQAGGHVSLHLTADSNTLGAVFDSSLLSGPTLVITAVPDPTTGALLTGVLGLLVMTAPRRRSS